MDEVVTETAPSECIVDRGLRCVSRLRLATRSEVFQHPPGLEPRAVRWILGVERRERLRHLDAARRQEPALDHGHNHDVDGVEELFLTARDESRQLAPLTADPESDGQVDIRTLTGLGDTRTSSCLYCLPVARDGARDITLDVGDSHRRESGAQRKRVVYLASQADLCLGEDPGGIRGARGLHQAGHDAEQQRELCFVTTGLGEP